MFDNQCHITKKFPSVSYLTYFERLSALKLQPLERRHLKFDLIECYKVLNNRHCVSLQMLLMILLACLGPMAHVCCLDRCAAAVTASVWDCGFVLLFDSFYSIKIYRPVVRPGQTQIKEQALCSMNPISCECRVCNWTSSMLAAWTLSSGHPITSCKFVSVQRVATTSYRRTIQYQISEL